jgi:hypothetical protein
MIQYPFHNAWIKWKMNDQPYQLRKNKTDICTFEVTKTEDPVKTYKEELLNNARMIREYYPGKFDVLYSGGVDSEVVLRVFNELKIKHNTIIVRYNDDYNYKEIECALEFVKSYNIPYKIIDFNLEKFYQNEAYDLFVKSSCIRAGRLPHIKFCADFCDNIPIMGEGDIYWRRTLGSDYTQKSDWKFIMSEASHNCNMYLNSLGRENVCDFFEFTPNVIKSYNQLPIIKMLLNDQIPNKISNWSSKWLIHKEIWPDLKKRVKLIGYEKNNEPGTTPAFITELQTVIENKIGPGSDYWYTLEELNRII